MKRLAILLAILLCILQGCDILSESITLDLDREELCFKAAGGSESFWITTNYQNVLGLKCPDWCYFSQNGTQITVTAEPNTAAEARSGEFTVSAGRTKKTVRITQEGASGSNPSDFSFRAYIPLYDWYTPDRYIQFGPDGHSFDAKVVTDMSSWEVVTPSEPWINILTFEGSEWFIIQFEDNTGEEKRTAEIEVIGHDGSTSISNFIRFEQRGGYYEPEIPEANGVKFAGATAYVDDQVASYIDAADTTLHTIWFKENLPESMFPAGRQYLVCPVVRDDLPCGALGRISGYGTESDGRQYVKYEPCELQKVFKELSIQEEDLDIGANVIKIIDAEGKEVPIHKTKASGSDRIEIHMDEHTFRNWDQTLIVKAKVDLSVALSMNLQVYDNEIQYFSFALKPDIKLDLDMEANIQTDFVDERYPFFTVLLGGFPLGPVVITPLIECSFVIGADGKIALHTNVKYQNNNAIRFGYQRNDNDFWVVNPDAEVMKGENKTFGEIYAEGTISAGLDESAGLGVYGTIVYVTVGVQERIKCGGHMGFDVEKLSKAEDLLSSADAYMFTDVTFQGVGALNSFGKTFTSVKSLESHIRLDSLYLYPTLRIRCTDVSSRQASIEVEAGRDLMLPVQVGINAYGCPPDGAGYQKWYTYDWWDPQENGYIKYTYDLGEQYRLPSVPTHFDEYTGAPVNLFTIDMPIDIPSGYYAVFPWFSIAGGPKIEYGGQVFFNAEGGAESAFKEILKDLAKSIPGETRYKWGSKEPIAGWAGVDISYKDANTPFMTVTFYGGDEYSSTSAGSLAGEVHVGNHTAGMKCGWTIRYRTDASAPTVLDIQDENFEGFSQNSSYLSGNVQELRLGAVKESALNCLGFSWPMLETLVLTGNTKSIKKLTTATFPSIKNITIGSLSQNAAIELVDCPNLRTFSIANPAEVSSLLVRNGGVGMNASTIESMTGLKSLKIVNAKQNASLSLSGLNRLEEIEFSGEPYETVTLSGCFVTGASISHRSMNAKNLVLQSCNLNYLHGWGGAPDAITEFETLTVTSCEKLTELRYENYGLLRTVKLASLPALKRLNITKCSMEAIEFDTLPALEYFNISDNHIPRTTVPPLFDSIRQRMFDTEYAKSGSYFNAYNAVSNFTYDQVYIYHSKFDYSESDYGYYYPDEPDSGYHFNLKRIGRQQGD